MTDAAAPPGGAEQAGETPAGDPPAEVWQIEAQLPGLRAAGQHDLATALGERLLEIREAELGPDAPAVVEIVESLAESYFQMTRLERAEALLLRALRAREAAAPPSPAALGDVLAQLGKVCRAAGALDRAEKHYRRAMETYGSAPAESLVGMATAVHGFAILLEERGQLREAEVFARKALEVREALYAQGSPAIAESLNVLGVVLRRKGELDEAERLYQRVLSIEEGGADRPAAAVTLINLGVLYTEKGEHAKAGEVLSRAQAMLDARGGPPDERAASLLKALANHHEEMGDIARALDAARRALALEEELFGPSHPSVAMALNNLASKVLAAGGERAEAERLLRRALTIVADTPAAPAFGKMVLNLAALRFAAEDVDEAEALATRALDYARRSGGPEHDDAADALLWLSRVAEERGEIDKAIERMLEVFKIHNKRPDLDHAVADMTRMGELWLVANEPDEAAKMFRDALDLAARARGKEHPSVARLIFYAGKVAVAQKNLKHALFCFGKALEIELKHRPRTDMALLDLLHAMGDADLELGKLGAAEAAYRHAGEIYAANFPAGDPHQALVPALLADVALKRKNPAKAAELYDQALAIAEQAFGKDDIRLQTILDKAGDAHLEGGNLARAEELSWRLLEMCEREAPGDDFAALPPCRRLGTIYMKTGDPRAKEMVERALRGLKAGTDELNRETAQLKAEAARRKGQS